MLWPTELISGSWLGNISFSFIHLFSVMNLLDLMCFRITPKMQVRDLHDPGERGMFKMQACQWACKKGTIALIQPATTTGRADKIWKQNSWRSDLFFSKYKIGQMHFSEKMTAWEIRDTVMSLQLEAFYKITAWQKYSWEEPQKVIQLICLSTRGSATPMPFQTNIWLAFSQKFQNHLKEN